MPLPTPTEYEVELNSARANYIAARDVLITMSVSLEEELALSEPWNESYVPPLNTTDPIQILTEKIEATEQLLKLHVYAKLDATQRDDLLTGAPIHRIVGTVDYIYTDFDTPHKLEEKFGIPWRDIMLYNNISAVDELVAGSTIEIPLPRTDPTAQRIFANNPVYDAHIGSRALGADVENDMSVDTTTDDVKVLDNANTFGQGIHNLLHTKPGEVYGEPAYGFNSSVGDDDESLQARRKIVGFQVEQALKQEPRIEEIVAVDVTERPSGFDIDMIITPINNPTGAEFSDFVPIEDIGGV